MDSSYAREHELVDDVVGDVEDEPSCEEGAAEVLVGSTTPVDVETTLAPDDEEQLDQLLEQIAAGEGAIEDTGVARGLGAPGGGWGGSQAQVQRTMRVASRNGLTITSNKRNSGSTTSDHHVSQRRSLAFVVSVDNPSACSSRLFATLRG